MADTNPLINDLKARWEADPASRIFAQLAEEYRKAGLFPEAIAVCRKGLEGQPGYITARVTMARALYANDDPSGAIQELDTVLSASGANLTANRLLADIYYEQGFYSQALTRYEHLEGLSPFEDGVTERIADCREKLPDIEEAEPGPEDEDTQTRQVQVPSDLIEAHSPDTASPEISSEADATETLTHEDSTPPVETESVETESSENVFKEAAVQVEAALTGDHSHTATAEEALMTSETLAELYESQGLSEKALRMYENLLLREPGNTVYIEKIETLKSGNSEGGYSSDHNDTAPMDKMEKHVIAPVPTLAERSPAMDSRLQKDIAELHDPARSAKIQRLRRWLDAVNKDKQGA